MAIIYTYPRVQNPDGTELIVVSETKNQNATRVMSINDIAGLIPGTLGGTVTEITLTTSSHGIDTGLKLWNGAWLATTQSISSSGSFDIGGTLYAGHGGTGQETYNEGDILYYDSTSTRLEKLPIAAPNKVLTVNSIGTLPEWGDPTDGIYGGSGSLIIDTVATNDSYSFQFYEASSASTKTPFSVIKGAVAPVSATSSLAYFYSEGVTNASPQYGAYVSMRPSGGATTITGVSAEVRPTSFFATETVAINAKIGQGSLQVLNSDVGVLTGLTAAATNYNPNAYGIYSIVESTASTVNYGAYLKASGGISNNYALITDGGQVGFNALTPHVSATVQIDSTTQGFLPPRMTTGEIAAIATPADGLIAYDGTLNELQFYNGTAWTGAGVGGGGIYGGSGSLSGGNTTVTQTSDFLDFNNQGDGFLSITGALGTPTGDHYAAKVINSKNLVGSTSAGLDVAVDGSNNINIGVNIEVEGSPNENIGVGIRSQTATVGTNIALFALASNGGAGSHAIIAPLGNSGFGQSSPDASAIVEMYSTTQGFLPPRMTSINISAITAPVAGLIAYDTDLNELQFYNGTIWTSAGGGSVTGDGIYDGSGSLSGGDTTVTQTGNFLDFTHNADGFLSITGSGGAPTGDHYAAKIANLKDLAGSIATGLDVVVDGTSNDANIGIDVVVDGSPLANRGIQIRTQAATAGNNTALYVTATSGTTGTHAIVTTGGNSGFGTSSPDDSAIVEIVSATQGLLIPRWTTGEETTNTAAWGSGEEGMTWFNTTTKQFMGWNATASVILG